MRSAALGCALATSLCFVASPARAMTVDEIVQHNIDARGGIDKMRGLHTLRESGMARFGDGDFTIKAPYAAVTKRVPEAIAGKIRSEVTIQGLTGVDGFDGHEAWRTEPWQGRRDPFRVSADETKSMADDADMDGPLVDWRGKGHNVEYLGTEEVDGTMAHKLRVTLKDGNIEYEFLDPDSWLLIRTQNVHYVRGAEQVSETDYGDYEQVEGVWLPCATDSGEKGHPKNFHIRIDHIEANVNLDDGLFAFPGQGVKVNRMIFPAANAPALVAHAPAAPPGQTPVFDSSVVSGLGARNIGSAAMSGRVSAVTGYNVNGKTTLFVGAASGGVWKSVDGGTTFKPVFDMQPVQSIGAITVDPWNWNNVWVGTGEAWTRNSTSIGDGIYKSTDGGSTWKNVGLPNSERIVRILVRPHASDVVYACVPGKLWSDSPDRGVYKTTDGGSTWTQILKGANLSTGCSELTMDPKNPDVLFAGMWDFRRKGWTFRSGGDGPDAPSASGLYRSADGGTTWTQLTPKDNTGLPEGPWGRVEVQIAPSDPHVVYAFIEGKSSALFRSDDGGQTWNRRDDSQSMVWRPFYFARLIVDPIVADRVFKPDYSLIVSEDGGKSFSNTSGGSHGDWHDVWIDPTNPAHIVGGDDGGLWFSWDGGSRWWKGQNLPIAQFYHVSVDDKDPYQVYGGLQDNSSWVGDSSYPGGITNQRWENMYGGDGFWSFVDPSDPDQVYAEAQGGFIGRVNRRTHAARDIQPKARYKEKLRFNWNTPIVASPTRKGTIYIGSQFLFRSRDHGDTWERISPDLTTNDPEKQKQEQSGGVTVDNSSAEMHTTIYAIAESPKDPNLVWAGTDDGNLQLTRDGGKTWNNLVGNVPGLPANSWVSWVEASRYDAGTAFVCFDRHTFGDMTPWVYRTTDFGKTWTRIVSPDKGVNGYAHTVKEDTVDPKLLFLGTELGLWISIDGGDKWAQFKGGKFPSVAVREIQVQPRKNDLVIATHGRGIWIVDDLTPLRALTSDTIAKSVAFLPRRPLEERMPANGGWAEGDATFVGQNPSPGAVVTYYQRARHLYGRIKLEVVDANGKVIDELTPTTRRGINRVSWNMQLKAPRVPRAAQPAFNATQGPRVMPGTYTLRLTKGDEVVETKITIGLDKRAPYSVADRKADFDAETRVVSLFNRMSDVVERLEAAHAGIEARMGALPQGDALADKLKKLEEKLEASRKKIVATKEGGAITGEERIREHTDELYGALVGWEGKPARYQMERIDALSRELDDVGKEVDTLVANDVKAVDSELRSRSMDPIPTAPSPQAELEDQDDGADDATVASAASCMLTRASGVCDAAMRAMTSARRVSREKD
ncbi:MAG TPA: hypothetical protein VF765_21365 [Polyangiaceae bacterium]